MSIYKNVGLCNLRVNVGGKRHLLVAFGDAVELPAEADKLDFVKGLVKSGALVKVAKPQTAPSDKKGGEDAAES